MILSLWDFLSENNFLLGYHLQALTEKLKHYWVPYSYFPLFSPLTSLPSAHLLTALLNMPTEHIPSMWKGLWPTWGPASLSSVSLRESLSNRTSSFLRLWMWRDLRSSHSPPGRDDKVWGGRRRHRKNLACRSNGEPSKNSSIQFLTPKVWLSVHHYHIRIGFDKCK